MRLALKNWRNIHSYETNLKKQTKKKEEETFQTVKARISETNRESFVLIQKVP